MLLKLSSAIILLSLEVPVIVAGGAYVDAAERSLQASLACLALNGDVAACCTEGADPDDGVCTVLSCLDITNGLSIRDGCSCRDIEAACDQVAVATFAPDMCDMVGECCTDDGATATNVDWDFCMAEAKEAGNFTLPDFAGLTSGETSTGGTSATAVPTNATPAATPAAPNSGSSSSKYAASAALAFIGSSSAFLFM
jgi:hypothetical protein